MQLNENAKLVLIIDAVNMIRNICVRTYLLGYPLLRNNQQITKIYNKIVLESVKKLLFATGIDLVK